MSLKCFNCGQLGHISGNCRQKRRIREATIKEVKWEDSRQKNFLEESQ
jgi:Zinc knuckle